jgi:AraC family transcriptional regulator
LTFTYSESLLVNVKIVDLPAARIAYLRHIGPYGETVGRFWDTFHRTRVAHGLSGNMYGIGLDDPAITPPEKCRYDAAVELVASAEVKPPFSAAQMPGGRYAVLEYSGDAQAIGAAWAAFFGRWLPESGMECDARPAFEWYRAQDGIDEATGRFTCALCIPVAPLSA